MIRIALGSLRSLQSMRIATQASIDLIAVRQSESTPRLRIIRLHCLDDPDLSTEQFNSRVFGGVQLEHVNK